MNPRLGCSQIKVAIFDINEERGACERNRWNNAAFFNVDV